jgi:hypothetical protein
MGSANVGGRCGLLRSAPFRRLRDGENLRWLVAGLRRQARETRVKIHRHPLTADADDDPVTFRIVRDQLRLVRFFLNGYYFGCFGHATEYADCSV